MDFNYSEMQQMLVDSASKLIADTYTLDDLRAQKHRANGLNQENWAQFAKMGWLALLLPEDAGGLGCPFEDAVVLNTVLGKGLSVEPFVSTAVIGCELIAALPDEDMRATLLRGIAEGGVRIALAHGEPGERYGDGGARKTIAKAEGDGFTLSGQKMLVLDGAAATHFVISASGDDGSLGLFIIEAGADGIDSEPYQLIDGTAATDLTLNSVQVGMGGLIASGEQAHQLLDRTTDKANVALMAQAVGAMEACNEVCATYVKERQQFGQPIGKFQALQHMMADMFVATHQSPLILGLHRRPNWLTTFCLPRCNMNERTFPPMRPVCPFGQELGLNIRSP